MNSRALVSVAACVGSALIARAAQAEPPTEPRAIEARFEGESGFHVQDLTTMKDLCVTPCESSVTAGGRYALVPAKRTIDIGQTGFLPLSFDAAFGTKQTARLTHARDPWFTGFGIGLSVLGTAGVVLAIAAPSSKTSDSHAPISSTDVRVGLGVLSGLVLLGGVVIIATGPRAYRVDVLKPDGSPAHASIAQGAWSPFTF